MTAPEGWTVVDRRRLETGWTVDTVHAFVDRILAERDQRYVERFQVGAKRFESIERSVDLAHQAHLDYDQVTSQRLEALVKAVDEFHRLRSDSQDQAVRAALESVRENGNAALIAAQLATQKAELATEKRFDSVNEFRAQLADQASHFMPRSEAQVLIQNNVDKTNAMSLQLVQVMQRAEVESLFKNMREVHEREMTVAGAQIAALQSRDDVRTGSTSGSDRVLNAVVLGIGSLIGVAGVIFGAIGLSR